MKCKERIESQLKLMFLKRLVCSIKSLISPQRDKLITAVDTEISLSFSGVTLLLIRDCKTRA